MVVAVVVLLLCVCFGVVYRGCCVCCGRCCGCCVDSAWLWFVVWLGCWVDSIIAIVPMLCCCVVDSHVMLVFAIYGCGLLLLAVV